MNNQKMQKMISIPPDLFDKVKDYVMHDQKHSELDQSMNKILQNKHMNAHDKWLLYREKLLKFAILTSLNVFSIIRQHTSLFERDP